MINSLKLTVYRIVLTLYIVVLLLTIFVCSAPYIPVKWFPILQLMPILIPYLGVIHFVGLLISLIAKKLSHIACTLPGICLCIYVLSYEVQIDWKNDPPSAEETLRITSFNIRNFSHNQKRVVDIAKALKGVNPDILCMQEFRNQHMNGGNRAIPYLQEELNLPHVQFVKLPYHIHGAIFFSKFPIVQIDTLFHLSNATNSGYLAYMKVHEDTIAVANIHLHSFQFPSWHWVRKKLKERLPMLIKRCNYIVIEQDKTLKIASLKLKKVSTPLIITGDMNAMPHTHILRHLFSLYTDSFLEKGNGIGWSFPYMKEPEMGIRIDYQFFSSDWQLIKHEIPEIRLSDHKPVSADYRLHRR